MALLARQAAGQCCPPQLAVGPSCCLKVSQYTQRISMVQATTVMCAGAVGTLSSRKFHNHHPSSHHSVAHICTPGQALRAV
jgi:hypothetical protein